MEELTFQKIIEELETMPVVDSVSMMHILSISDELRQLITWMIRKNRFQDEELANYLGLDSSHARKLLFTMMYKGVIKEAESDERKSASDEDDLNPTEYQTNIRIAPRYRVHKDITDIFDD
ncbi:MAG: hypothetical protein JXB15_02710 [Anaerolineales bacterium]|nr:hypothetical protein [Anaerolineales bacterium]